MTRPCRNSGGLPRGLPPHLANRRLKLPRPDFTITARDANGKLQSVKLVEVKMGQDTRLEDKLPSIHAKYAPATRAIWARRRRRTEVLPILIGVGGRIPSATVMDLITLGLTPYAAKKLCNKLNIQAVTWLREVVQTRRMLEHKQTHATMRRTDKRDAKIT